MNLSRLIKKTASGRITGGADNDPSGITTYSITGATTGYTQTWLLLLSTPLLIVFQGMSSKIGYVRKKGLASVIEEQFGRKIALAAMVSLLVVNTLTIGADLSIMGSVLNNFVPFIPEAFFVLLFSLVIWFVVVFEIYKVLDKLLLWLVVVFFAYIASGVLSKPDLGLVLKSTLIPQIQFTPVYFAAATALLGTTITPYLFFWQTSEEVEDHIPKREAKSRFKEIAPGFIFSNLVAYFIILSSASVLFYSGSPVANIDSLTASDIALALEPVVGGSAFILFSIGIIGGGLLALPVLAASSSYAVAELFGWKEGLNEKPSHAKGCYAVLTVQFFVGAAFAVLGINPIVALFFSQILAGIAAPGIIVLIILISSNKKIMGGYANSLLTKIVGWFAVVVMIAAVLLMFVTTLF